MMEVITDAHAGRRIRAEKIVYRPRWHELRNDPGKHLIFGRNPTNDEAWETVDLPFNLILSEWPWSEVAAIHCVSMLYQWDYEDAIAVLKKAFSALRGGGIMWLGESHRDADPAAGRLSLYSPTSLARISSRIGFKSGIVTDPLVVTGRPADRNFALRCEKP